MKKFLLSFVLVFSISAANALNSNILLEQSGGDNAVSQNLNSKLSDKFQSSQEQAPKPNASAKSEPVVVELESLFDIRVRSEINDNIYVTPGKQLSDYEQRSVDGWYRNSDYKLAYKDETITIYEMRAYHDKTERVYNRTNPTTTNKCYATVLSNGWLLTHRDCLERNDIYHSKPYSDSPDYEWYYYKHNLSAIKIKKDGYEGFLDLENMSFRVDKDTGAALVKVKSVCSDLEASGICQKFWDWIWSESKTMTIPTDYKVAILTNIEHRDRAGNSFTDRKEGFFIPGKTMKQTFNVVGLEHNVLNIMNNFKNDNPLRGEPLFFKNEHGSYVLAAFNVGLEDRRMMVFSPEFTKTAKAAMPSGTVILTKDFNLVNIIR